MTFNDATLIPVYRLNDFVWAALQENLGWTTINGRVPIAAGGMPTQFTDAQQPFIVYGYAFGRGAEPYERTVSVSYTIYSFNQSDVDRAITVIGDLLGEHDDSATLLNLHTTKQGKVGVRFGTVRMVTAEGPSPAVTEGGRIDGIISLTATYFYKDDLSVTSDFVL